MSKSLNNPSFIPQIPVYQQISTVEWAGTSAPESDPACGFEDEYCKPEGMTLSSAEKV